MYSIYSQNSTVVSVAQLLSDGSGISGSKNQCMIPTAGLVVSASDVLLECCLSWRNVLQSLIQVYKASLIQSNISTKIAPAFPLICFTNLTRHVLELFKSIVHLRKSLLSFPGSLLSSTIELRYSITPGETMVDLDTLLIRCDNHLMNSYALKV